MDLIRVYACAPTVFLLHCETFLAITTVRKLRSAALFVGGMSGSFRNRHSAVERLGCGVEGAYPDGLPVGWAEAGGGGGAGWGGVREVGCGLRPGRRWCRFALLLFVVDDVADFAGWNGQQVADDQWVDRGGFCGVQWEPVAGHAGIVLHGEWAVRQFRRGGRVVVEADLVLAAVGGAEEVLDHADQSQWAGGQACFFRPFAGGGGGGVLAGGDGPAGQVVIRTPIEWAAKTIQSERTREGATRVPDVEPAIRCSSGLLAKQTESV